MAEIYKTEVEQKWTDAWNDQPKEIRLIMSKMTNVERIRDLQRMKKMVQKNYRRQCDSINSLIATIRSDL